MTTSNSSLTLMAASLSLFLSQRLTPFNRLGAHFSISRLLSKYLFGWLTLSPPLPIPSPFLRACVASNRRVHATW